jgi:hypothetical protein
MMFPIQLDPKGFEWKHGDENFKKLQSLMVAATQGDDAAVMALIDFVEEFPLPPFWPCRDRDSIINWVNHKRSVIELKKFTHIEAKEEIVDYSDTLLSPNYSLVQQE